LKLLREYLATAGAGQARIVALDLSAGAPFKDIFDLVLVDAPCTGLGTLRREVDIRLAPLGRRYRRSGGGSGADAAPCCEPGGARRPAGLRHLFQRAGGERGRVRSVAQRRTRLPPGRPESLTSEGVPPGLLDGQGHLHTRPDLHGLEAFFAAAADRARAR
jgi:16S rRNA C967 or C1407 C5-methylase (RsmB/RsmF family)